MNLKQLIKQKFGTVRECREVNPDWSEASIRTLMSRGAEVLELANGDYVLIARRTRVIKTRREKP
jgi:hypothetical protein